MLQHDERCKVCVSPLRTEIEERMRRGESLRSIQRWLAEQGVKVSHPTLSTHRREHFDFYSEALQRYEESKALYQEGLTSVTQCITALEEDIARCREIRDLLAELITSELRQRRKIHYALAHLFGVVLSEIRQHTNLLHQIQGAGPDIIVSVLERVYEEDRGSTEKMPEG